MQLASIHYTYSKATIADLNIFHDSCSAYAGVIYEKMFFQAEYLRILQDQNYLLLTLICDQKNEIAGCAVLKFDTELFAQHPYIEILHLYIQPKYRKLNAAENLYSYIEEIASKKKANKIKVACGISSTLNQRFYSRKSFIFTKKAFQKNLY
jgi:ribosomal protein S18 acetylase RimI-like enzyme